MKKRRTLKPFAIMVILFFTIQFTGLAAMQPFMIQILKAYESPIPWEKAVIVLKIIENVTHVAFVCLIRFIGRRRMYLMACTGIFFSTLAISIYGFVVLPNGFNSFDQQSQSSQLENKYFGYIPLICIFVWDFFTNFGLYTIPGLYLSEILPFK